MRGREGGAELEDDGDGDNVGDDAAARRRRSLNGGSIPNGDDGVTTGGGAPREGRCGDREGSTARETAVWENPAA